MKIVSKRQLRLLGQGLLSAAALGYALFGSYLPAGANDARGPIQLRDGSAQMRGVTAGERSLAEMAGRDRHRKVCLGYAAAEPNHIVRLTQPESRLRIMVNSEGQDTTLLVMGPRGIDCNDNHSREHRDAAVTYQNWPAGEYRIWVGSIEAGDRINYQLRINNPNQ